MSDPTDLQESRARVIAALHELAAFHGHDNARRAIVEWQEDGFLMSGHLALIQDLSDSLQRRFTDSPDIETLPS